MKITKIIPYVSILLAIFILLHIFFPGTWPSGVKALIDAFFLNPLMNWWCIFPIIGLGILAGLVMYYGIHFLASFGTKYDTEEFYYTGVSIVIASKNEKILLERTLNSIAKLDYPRDKLQIVVVTSGSTDNSTDFCKMFSEKHKDLEMIILSEDIPKRGKPAALNYGLEYVNNEIFVLYDSGCVLTPDTLKYLIAPFQYEKNKATIGPVLVKNWKENALTRAILLDYSTIAGGGILFEIKNRIGASAYSFGRNFAVRTEYLRKYGGFNEDSLTEDLYLSQLLNLDGIDILFTSKAKVYEHVPNSWDILKVQRTRWMAGFLLDAPQLMEMKNEEKDGKPIIIARNLTMFLFGNMDSWMNLVIGFSILFFLIGEYYLLTWALICLFFQFGCLFNAVRKYADKHYSVLFYFPISGFIHLYMILRQFTLPEDMGWDQTPMILEKQEKEINALSNN
ncbi:MAG: glycosyltransferase [Promethearchaeota archaeon]|nr:MAG: glycosyltransferase [Candidatus Lokiarchaeota archaeon]